MKTLTAAGALILSSVQMAAAHPSLSPHVHLVDGGAHISWLEVAAGVTATALAVTYYRFRQAQIKAQMKKQKVRRK